MQSTVIPGAVAALLLTIIADGVLAQAPGTGSGGSCTQVIGFSQVGQQNGGWYVTGGAFEARAGDDAWQLLWQNGASVDRWKSPDYAGWDQALISPCASNSDSPDRVVLSVSGPHGDDVSAWQADIEAAVATIRQKLPSVKLIVLQAVVGAPRNSPCYRDRSVRAAWQHYPIREAIRNVVTSDSEIREGFAPLVGSCDGYRDSLGHLTADEAVVVGDKTAGYYTNSAP